MSIGPPLAHAANAGVGMSFVVDPMQQGSRFVSIDAIDQNMSWCEHELWR